MVLATATEEADPLVAVKRRKSIPQAAKIMGVSAETCWRWCLHGVGGVRLGTFFIGGRRFTSEDLLREFIKKRNAASNGEPVETEAVQSTTEKATAAAPETIKPATMKSATRKRERQKQVAAADRELANEGL